MKTFKNTMLYAFICAVWALIIWYWVSVFTKAKKQRIKDEEHKVEEIHLYCGQKDDEE